MPACMPCQLSLSATLSFSFEISVRRTTHSTSITEEYLLADTSTNRYTLHVTVYLGCLAAAPECGSAG
jgi:hypothetical protein